MADVPQAVIDALSAPSVKVTRKVDIYEADGTTPYLLDAPFESGSISVDKSRSERRQFDMTLNPDAAAGKLTHAPGKFWFDKILKVYRGLEYTKDVYDQGWVPGYFQAEYTTARYNYITTTDSSSFEGGTGSWGVQNVTLGTGATGATAGIRALKVIPTGASNDSCAVLSLTNLTPLISYKLSGNITLVAAQTGTLDSRARALQLYYFNGATLLAGDTSTQAANSAGTTALSKTFIPPAGTTRVEVRLYNGSINSTEIASWDDIWVEETNNYCYADLTGLGTYVVQAGDYLLYSVQWPDGASVYASVDLVCTDGTTLRDSGISDYYGSGSAHPSLDLPGAKRAWLTRAFNLSTWAGKTINHFNVASENDPVGATVAWYREIYIFNVNTSTITKVIYGGTTTDPATTPVPGVAGYNQRNTTVTGIRAIPAQYTIATPTKFTWSTQIGEFVLDKVDQANFPSTLSVSGRDYTKKLLTSKFPRETAFTSGSTIESVIKTIAQNGGISKFLLPATGKTLGADKYFDRGTVRWDAITDLANSYGYDAYFSADGYLTIEAFQDPITSPIQFVFKTGVAGNISTFRKSTSDTRIYNHIVVIGGDANVAPIIAEASNTQPDSSTNITKLGDRVYEFASSFITTQTQAQDVADKYLQIHALEQFELGLDTLVFPFLEVGRIIQFIDPHINPGDPDKFLLSSITIPMQLGPMSSVAKRVTIVG